MFKNLFNPQNTFWHWIGKVPAILALSTLWFIVCIPIITIVPATIALYDSVSRCLRPDEAGMFSRFFRTFWKELPRGLLLSLIWAVVVYFLVWGMNVLTYLAANDPNMENWATAYQVGLIIPVGLFFWMVTLESRFVYNFFGLLKNTLLFFFAYLPKTLLMSLIAAAGIAACYFYLPLLFFMPALMVLFLSLPVESVFQKLIAQKEAEEAAES